MLSENHNDAMEGGQPVFLGQQEWEAASWERCSSDQLILEDEENILGSQACNESVGAKRKKAPVCEG